MTQPTPRKPLPPLAWAGIGCGAVTLLAILVGLGVFLWARDRFDGFTRSPDSLLAEQVADFLPNYDWVDPAEADGPPLLRDRESGEMVEFDPATLFQDDAPPTPGVTTDPPPAWLPAYPGASHPDSLRRTHAGQIRGLFTFTTADEPSLVADHFETELGKGGSRTSTRRSSSWDLPNYQKAFRATSIDGRSFEITAVRKDQGPTRVIILYTGQP